MENEKNHEVKNRADERTNGQRTKDKEKKNPPVYK